MTEDDYRKEIIEMVKKISRNDILRYIYILVSKIMEREGNDV